MGQDFEELVEQKVYELETLKKAGITLGTDIKGVADTATDDQKDPNAAEETAEGEGASGKTKPAKGKAKS
jgi:hypothetical protein